MSSLSLFLKGNKKVRENTKYAATKSLKDENGKPLEWEIRPLTSRQNEILQEECTTEVPVKGKPNAFRPKLDSKLYLRKMIATSVVFPDLYNVELQNSYGVMDPEELLLEMVDDPGEYNNFATFIQGFNGFASLEDKVEEVKN